MLKGTTGVSNINLPKFTSKWRYESAANLYYKYDRSGFLEVMSRITEKKDVKLLIESLEKVLNIELEKRALKKKEKKESSVKTQASPVLSYEQNLPEFGEESRKFKHGRANICNISSKKRENSVKMKSLTPLTEVPVLRGSQDNKHKKRVG